MKRARLLEEEVLYYLTDEWEDSIKRDNGGVWLTTRALLLKLENRGILTTWPTLNLKLNRLLAKDKINRINTSAGYCWRAETNDGKDEDND